MSGVGAKRVYAVEACPNMAEAARAVMVENKLEDTVMVLFGKVEDVRVPEKVCRRTCNDAHVLEAIDTGSCVGVSWMM